MKARALIACITIVAAFALLAACQPGSVADTDSCMTCHQGDNTLSLAMEAAQGQYADSGHLNGPRLLEGATAATYEFAFEGGNSMYCSGNSVSASGTSNCSRCHTHQGFVDFVAAGMPDPAGATPFLNNYSAASQPGCFTCHQPHTSGDFTTLRKSAPETLVYGTETFTFATTDFNGGSGNLCVTCHKVLTPVTGPNVTPTQKLSAMFRPEVTFPQTWRSSSGPHHGVQADFMMGVNNYPYASKTYIGQSVHLGTSIPDSCVTCHMYGPTDARAGFSLELGGHGMYLTGEVHGQTPNVIGGCRSTSCHGWPASVATTTKTVAVPGSLSTPPVALGSLTGGFETSNALGNINERLDWIRANRDILIGYFGNGTAYFGAGGAGPIESLGGADVASGEFGKDWVFAQANLDDYEAYAFWNFKLFIEDRSQGIHNPKFALQILYDAVEALNVAVPALPDPVGTRP